MKRLFKPISCSLLLSISILASCHREIEPLQETLYPPGLIKKTTSITTEVGYGTTTRYDTYYYDSIFQLTKIISTYDGRTTPYWEYLYFYRGNNISFSVKKYPENLPFPNDTTFYTFRNDTLTQVIYNQVDKHQTTNFFYRNDTIDVLDSTFRDGGRVKVDSYQFILNETGLITESTRGWSYDYDYHKNPFRNIPYAESQNISLIRTMSYNVIRSSNMIATFNYSYEYNEQDFPVKVRSTNNVFAENPTIMYEYW